MSSLETQGVMGGSFALTPCYCAAHIQSSTSNDATWLNTHKLYTKATFKHIYDQTLSIQRRK